MDNKDLKDVIDLESYIDQLAGDRPPIGVFLKHLNIDPHTMQNCVMSATTAIHFTTPEMAFELANRLFKIGLTIGYKYAIKREMEREFGIIEDAEVINNPPCNHPLDIDDEQGPNGSPSGERK